MFKKLIEFIRQVIHKVIPYRQIENAETVETPLSSDMINALNSWYDAYCDKAPWVDGEKVKSMNLPALISSEVARQVTLEMKWNITGETPEELEEQPEPTPEDVINGTAPETQVLDINTDNPRSEYLKGEFERLMRDLRQKLEQGCAAGGMVIRPYPSKKDGKIYFGYTMNWSMYPVSFNESGDLRDVIFRDVYQDGDITYTRLERHIMDGKDVKISQKVFKSANKETLGVEVPLSSVDIWADLAPEATIHDTDGPLFGWFKVAAANSVDTDCPMGVSVFHKAMNIIKQADLQYSRLLWEYEGSELAIDVDPLALRPKDGDKSSGIYELPQLNERLFRGINLDEDHYSVFSPTIRDGALINGLNRILMMIEDTTGLSRGTLSDSPAEARTATELRILRQRTYATIADNQAALERCLRDVIRAMDKYTTLYKLAPEGTYEASFEWDDSILTDRAVEMQERLELLAQGIISRAEMRQWYTGETEAQAKAAIEKMQQETMNQNAQAMMQQAQIQSATQQMMNLDDQETEPVPPGQEQKENPNEADAK